MFFAEICKKIKKRNSNEEGDNPEEDEQAALEANDMVLECDEKERTAKLEITVESPDHS